MLDLSSIGINVTEKFSYDWRDVVLYNLSVGAGAGDIEYVYEKQLKAVPTFGVIPCAATFGTDPYHETPLMPTSKIEGLRHEGTVHMDHKLVIKKPVPVSGSLNIEKVISNVYDRGEKGAKVDVDIIARDENGEEIFRNTMGYLKKYAGGFGGPPIPPTDVVMPQREPDFAVEGAYPENTPLLYRLTGDTFALHVDPEFAKKSGFEKPIVHGLCSLGYAVRIIIDQLFKGEPERIKEIQNQFRTIAYPEQKFTVMGWKEKDGECLFRMVNQDGKPIIDFGRIRYE